MNLNFKRGAYHRFYDGTVDWLFQHSSRGFKPRVKPRVLLLLHVQPSNYFNCYYVNYVINDRKNIFTRVITSLRL